MKIYVKKVDGVVLPQKGSELAAGYDIVATSGPKIVGNSGTIPNIEGEEIKAWRNIDYIEYETNLFIAPTAVTFHTLIHPRSSVSKYNLVLANSIGLIDNDYRGMVICRFKYIWQPTDFFTPVDLGSSPNLLYTNSLVGTVNMDKIYKKGDKIAQLVVEPTVQIEWEFVDDLNQTERGEGGFGSTDVKKPEFPPNTIVQDSGLIKMFENSNHNVQTPPKNAYINAIKEREKGIE